MPALARARELSHRADTSVTCISSGQLTESDRSCPVRHLSYFTLSHHSVYIAPMEACGIVLWFIADISWSLLESSALKWRPSFRINRLFCLWTLTYHLTPWIVFGPSSWRLGKSFSLKLTDLSYRPEYAVTFWCWSFSVQCPAVGLYITLLQRKIRNLAIFHLKLSCLRIPILHIHSSIP